MGIAERKERQRNEVRDSILSSAWKLVNEDGWQSLSIRKIADAIEYSIPVVYDHFENKEAILSEFNRRGFRLLADRLKQAREAHRKPEIQLEAITYAYWDFAFENKEYYQLMFGLGMPSCESVRSLPELMDFTGVIQATIEAAGREAGKTDINLPLKVQSFWSMLHGLVSINLMAPPARHEGITTEELNKMVLHDFINGFTKALTS